MTKLDSGLTDEQRAELDALEALPDDQIDTSDIPETLDWSGAKRGLFYQGTKRKRPVDGGAQRAEQPKSDA